MKLLLLVVLLVMVPLFQVSIAPLFPVATATCDYALVTLALLLVFSGPRVFMLALPVIAILLGFVSDHSPALLLVGYLPLMPTAGYLANLGLPLNRYAQTVIAATATGVFMRLLLSLAAVTQGASFGITFVVSQVLLPGALLDLVLLSIVYFPLRFVGWVPQSTSLRRGSY